VTRREDSTREHREASTPVSREGVGRSRRRAGFWRPPRPRAVDWIAGSACAGVLLGLAELLVAAPVVRLPPALGLALVCGAAALVTACGGALLLLLRLGGIRSAHSGLVGGMLGPLCVVAGVPLLLPRVDATWTQLATAAGAALLLAPSALAGALLAKRVRGGRPASAALGWTGASLALAGLAWQLYGSPADAAGPATAAIAIGVAIGALGFLGRAPGARAPRTHYGGMLLALCVAAAVATSWAWWLPWLLADRDLPEVGVWPPNLVLVALEAPGARDDASAALAPALAVLGANAVSYPTLSPEPELRSLLALPDGSLLGAHLHARGFATGAIGIAPETAAGLGIAESDEGRGGRRVLEESAAWMAGAPWLLGPASDLLGLLGLDREPRSPEQVGSEAARWLLNWRTRRAPAPFFLLVDLRAPGPAEALDAGLRRIRDRLEDLGLESSTLLVVAAEAASSESSPGSLRALVLPPASWPNATRLEVAPQVWGRSLSQSLLQIALSDGEGPVRLPGVDQELSPPKLR
jgi:hypothetical protein